MAEKKYAEAAALLEEFLCGYQSILLTRGINTSEAVCKQNELIDEYAERIAQIIAATLGSELNPDGLPVGLTISEDGELLNWRGENYVKQSTLWSERDEWKERYDSVLEGRNRWSGIVDGIYRRFYPREKYCLPIDPTDMINEAIDAIERERDEWKAKATVATLKDI